MKTPDPNALNALSKAPISDPVVAGTQPPASNPTAAGTTPPASTMKKLTIRIDEKLLGRVRAAYLHELMTGSAGGKASLGAWVAARLEDVVKASEAAHNNGQSYTPVDGGILPRGPLQ